MPPGFFFTKPDLERLNIRGSRDPLGFVPLWARFGRKVVTNLTTASNTMRGFTTALLGLHFAEQVAASNREDYDAAQLGAFLMFEQLAGYVRYSQNKDDNLRGITEVRRRLEQDPKSLVLGRSPEHQILSSQRAYGLWGLYLNPAVDSGLLVRDGLALTPEARTFLEEQYFPILRSHGLGDGESIRRLLREPEARVNPSGRDGPMFHALGAILSPRFSDAEVHFYGEYLIRGARSPANAGWQPAAAEILRTRPRAGEFTHSVLDDLIGGTESIVGGLHEHLIAIRDLQWFLVAVANLFDYLQHCRSKTPALVAEEVTRAWGAALGYLRPGAIEAMVADFAAVFSDNLERAEALSMLARLLHAGDYEAAIHGVLAHNTFVMNERHKAEPWLRVENGKLEVLYSDRDSSDLVTRQRLQDWWRHSFYLDPLKVLSDELYHAP